MNDGVLQPISCSIDKYVDVGKCVNVEAVKMSNEGTKGAVTTDRCKGGAGFKPTATLNFPSRKVKDSQVSPMGFTLNRTHLKNNATKKKKFTNIFGYELLILLLRLRP